MTTYHYDSTGHLYCAHDGVLYSWLGVFAEHNAEQIIAHVTSTPWARHLWEPMQALRGQSAESLLRDHADFVTAVIGDLRAACLAG